MKSFKKYLLENNTTLNNDKLLELGMKIHNTFKTNSNEENYELLKQFLDNLDIGNKAPRGYKTEYEKLKYFRDNGLETWERTKKYFPQPVGASISWWNEEYLKSIIEVFSKNKNSNKKKQITEIEFGNIKIINQSALGEKKFIELSKVIEKLLTRLKDEYKKSLDGNVKIIFKPSTELSSKAKYKQDKDEIWIRNSPDTLKLFDKELYGWVPYIIIHELGHRYEKLHEIPKWFNSSYITSKYSKTAGWADEEKWAECFAISFFGETISPEYSNWEGVINKFKDNFLK